MKIGDKVQIIFEDKKELLEVLETKKNTFRVKPITNHQSPITIFVYGRQVDDFHTVDYEAISMLNVSATQELSKIIEKQNAKIEAQETEIQNLKNQLEKVNQLETIVQQLQAQLENQ